MARQEDPTLHKQFQKIIRHRADRHSSCVAINRYFVKKSQLAKTQCNHFGKHKQVNKQLIRPDDPQQTWISVQEIVRWNAVEPDFPNWCQTTTTSDRRYWARPHTHTRIKSTRGQTHTHSFFKSIKKRQHAWKRGVRAHTHVNKMRTCTMYKMTAKSEHLLRLCVFNTWSKSCGRKFCVGCMLFGSDRTRKANREQKLWEEKKRTFHNFDHIGVKEMQKTIALRSVLKLKYRKIDWLDECTCNDA